MSESADEPMSDLASETTQEASALPIPPVPIEPRCPLYGQCGGCQLQHVPYDEQLAWKTAEVARLFAAALPAEAVTVEPCAGSPREYGYRSKLTPHFPRPREGRVPPIGFLRADNHHRTLDVPTCPLATDAINEHLPALRAGVAANLATYRRGASLLLRDAASGVTSDFRAVITEQVGDLTLNFRAGDFFQNNPFLLPSLAAHVAHEARAGGARFLVDAYCGSGLLALTSAPGFERVVGVEVSPSSVKWARENATRNGRDNCTFLAADATAIFRGLAAAGLPPVGADAAVIIDPPRKGCSAGFLTQLIAYAPRTIIYVSCNPETQVRDLVQLVAAGYRVTSVQPFDMFPQTRHLECVATLTRR
jgi:tRNA/tmRNA/rRNA uracil-C5-methylase (TrmA/RlmC/RlmD family)